MNRRLIHRTLVIAMCLAIFVSSIPLEGISFAAPVVEDILYSRQYNSDDDTPGYLEIQGTDILVEHVLLRDRSSQLFVPGDISALNSRTLVVNLTEEEVAKFSGIVLVDATTVDLDIGEFPTVDKASNADGNRNVNYGLATPDDLVITGNYLSKIMDVSSGAGTIFAEYGKGSFSKPFYDGGSTNDNSLTVDNPTPPGDAGFQSIFFTREETLPSAIDVKVVYQFDQLFRLVDSLNLTDPEMFPNMGAHEDTVYFTADDFDGSVNDEYRAYFLSIDGSDDYNAVNSAEFVSLNINIDGTSQDKLTVKVPTRVDEPADPAFPIGTYHVVLAREKDGEVIAEQQVFKPGSPTVKDEYTVVESRFRPEIISLNPDNGPDSGGLTTIVGSNILEIDLPGLSFDPADENVITAIDTPGVTGEGTELIVDYEDGVYGEPGTPVTVTRSFKVQIGKLATFKEVDYSTGPITNDHLPITTGNITDALTEPVKDVQVEITTTITEIGGTGKVYVFNQTAYREDGFTFLPSTLEPTVTEIIPETIQAIQSGTEYKLKEETLFTIKGDNFLVERIVEDDGTVVTRKPIVLFKKEKGNIDVGKFQLGFFPSDTVDGVTGVIKYKHDEDALTDDVLDLLNVPIKLEMTILDDAGEIVDGTIGNDVGTKMIIRIPNESDQVPLKDIGIKQIQVVNPTRGSTAFGGITTFLDELEIIETTDNPIIESVEPNIVTVTGGEDVEVIGSNFQEGLKLYLDGEEITNYTRELDPLGTKYIVTFTAPAGREGLTQLQVVNPGGGMDVRDFSYVKSFNSDPVITNFTPTKGIPNTLVVVNGDNYLQPDTSVSNTSGVNGLRLIGTRVFLDGVDVNDYNKDTNGEIEFKEYSSPKSDYSLLTYSADRAVWSPFNGNATIIKTLPAPVPSENPLFYIGNDGYGNPMIDDRDDEEFFFTYEPIDASSGNYFAHKPADGDTPEDKVALTITAPAADSSPGVTVFDFTLTDGTVYQFTGSLDNKILSTTIDEDGKVVPRIADYIESVVFTRQISGIDFYYTLEERINGDLVFTNNSDLTYYITYDGSDFKANEVNKVDVDVNIIDEIVPPAPAEPTKLEIDNIEYTMITPYVKDLVTAEVTGDHTRIINAKQLTFDVPVLSTGTGFKDLEVINPDTRKDEKVGDEGFYYIKQSSSHPVISTIEPNKGSIDGGYVIKINGSEFEDDMSVYIDSVLVPSGDTYVSLDGDYVTVKVPACIKDLQGDFGIDELSVPVVVLNQDGGSASKQNGFTYVVPISNPRIDEIILEDGSANGGETVQILGYDFRYFEPYEDVGTLPGYNYPDDTFVDLFKNNQWDDLLSLTVDPSAIEEIPFEHPKFDTYKESPILPTVFFGENEAKIVEFKKGYIKVIAPDHDAGPVSLYLVNNDQGVSNVLTYTYTSSVPTITQVSPDKGNRIGQEFKDIYGTEFYQSELNGYIDDDDTSIEVLSDVKANVRFGDIDNREVGIGENNDGLINAGRAEVTLLGDLTAIYDATLDTIELQVVENGKVYKRTFNNYDDSEVYLPMEMLRFKTSTDPAPETFEYYHPSGYSVDDLTIWNDNIYEYIKVEIEDRRLFVERGYAPNVEYVSGTRLTVVSPSYHTIDTVPLVVTNNDGGQAITTFTYTNPDSEPKILEVNPYSLSVDGNYNQVQASIQGGVEIEIVGLDFRDNVIAYIGTKEAEILEETTRVIDGVTYDVLILRVPVGTDADVDQKYPIVIENTDAGMANSTTLKDLIIPSGSTSPTPFFFVYRKPLSGPVITGVEPVETSVFGGNTIVITGTDFRSGALVIIGTSGGVPITGGAVSDEGTKLTITTPVGMSLGDKTVQVINSDFGTASLEGALKVVSYPTVEEGILTEDGESSATVVNVEGGENVMIKGTGFFSGARVFFGGTRETFDEKPEGDVVGLFKDDTYIVLTDAYEATSVNVVDENTMIVTTPEITKEDTFNITVINADTGISENNADLEFSEPVPTTPQSLKVRVVDDRFIQLYNYTSEGVEYYEVYYYLGSKTSSELIRDDRQDLNYLGTTTLEPYKVNRIPGFENRQSSDILYFALKAVNKYGVSNWSGFAVLNYNQLEDVEELGPEDVDGELGVPKGKDYMYDSDGVTSVINLSEKELPKEVKIDLRGKEDGSPETRIINVPREMVESSQSLIYVDYLDSKLQFIPVGLNTPEFRELNFYDRAYGRITSSTEGNSYNSMLKLSLPRGKKTATKIFTLDVEAINNEESKVVGNFSAPMDLQLAYNDTYLSEEQENSLQLYRYDKVLNKWELMSATINKDNNLATVRTSKPGSYVVLYDR